MQRFCVIGHPVAHSLSPKIHAMFAQQCALSIVYDTQEFELGGFREGIARLRREQDLIGANVTVPFKLDAYDYCDTLTPRAVRAKAVNTLLFQEKGVLGDNTDGVGFIRDLMVRHNQELDGTRVLVAGAGGAARGVITALQSMGCAKISIANRTLPKAQALGKELGIEALSYIDAADSQWDIIVNATSATLSGAAPEIPGRAFQCCKFAYDLFYSSMPTPFMRLACEAGVEKCVDGLGMLVEQAAESFKLWLGCCPETESVYQSLRSELQV